MRKKSVAVLDVRSSEICAAIAEKGVNNTFIIKSKHVESYEGYAEGELLDVDDFIKAVRSCIDAVQASSGVLLKSVYVGIPCEFINTVQTDKVFGFQSMQRISGRHIQNVIKGSFPAETDGYTVVRCGALTYILSDKRRLLDPVGMVSDSLRAKLSYFTCKTAFLETVVRALGVFPSIKVFNWLPQNYTESMYLFNGEKREGYNLLFDFGHISSTFSVTCGNGVAYSEAFSIGVAHIAVLLMEALEIPYDVALALLKRVNLNARDKYSQTEEEYEINGERYNFSPQYLRELIREGLDGICEMIEACIQSFVSKDMSGAPIYITGEGVGIIRGTIEHFSSRLVTPVEVIAPKVPYYDKPRFSSLFSLLSAALGGVEEQ